MEETALHSQFLAEQYALWFEREELICQIAQKALENLLLSLPKPWLTLGAGSAASGRAPGIPWVIDPAKNWIPRVSKERTWEVGGEGEWIPILSHRIGSIFLILTLCFSCNPAGLLRECHRMLIPQGEIVIGFIPRRSLWGKLYRRKKEQGHPFYRFARFYSIKEIEHLTMEAGFSIQGITSTLFQKPGEVHELEIPMERYHPLAGFLFLLGERLG